MSCYGATGKFEYRDVFGDPLDDLCRRARVASVYEGALRAIIKKPEAAADIARLAFALIEIGE